MSSLTPPPPSLRYYCHHCDRTVSIPRPTSRDADVFCPVCAGGFVEELLDDPNPSPPSLFPSSSFLDIRHPSDLSGFLGPPSSSAPPVAAPPPINFNVTDFLHGRHLGGRATIHIILEGSSDPPSVGPRDILLGESALEELIHQLAENDPNRYGTPPAAKSTVASLPDVAVTADMMAADGGAQCAVCMDAFHIGAAAKQLPCNHVFHKDCILPWLELHSSCPVCRYELPTDGPVRYNRQRDERNRLTAAESLAPPSPRTLGRRLRVSLPCPAALGGQAESSTPSGQDAGGGNNDPSYDHRHSYDDLD